MTIIDEHAFEIMAKRAGIKPRLKTTARRFIVEYEAAKASEQPRNVSVSVDPNATYSISVVSEQPVGCREAWDAWFEHHKGDYVMYGPISFGFQAFKAAWDMKRVSSGD